MMFRLPELLLIAVQKLMFIPSASIAENRCYRLFFFVKR